ncbi:fumarylacetoacetate hydrolase family protein [Neolewinella lacunae]|uniref:Fumarylacetoacetate hydrolase family protein n=1 Tax=Neolewinella lacunae TaxID=1517758 RepID=A0A923PH51_9BACT|nr:fumarylacetoacetate hydrolase family protein [Neolewinella lacunae]MBC6993975.1 fumarylacetoacetate hydrolase family protein [Neolewinella lacunae]MDN3635510.1 fumarylacetoacetate hydrolase family protein [Neolewinella lacunae]
MKIFCIGRNYAAHAAELGNDRPTEPMVFMKPPTAILPNNKPFYYPDYSQNIHFETELVVKIAKNGRHVQPEFALDYVGAIGLGLDLTARDLQDKLKANGHPWEIAKGFDNSAPLGTDFFPPQDFDDLNDITFRLEKNGQQVQHGQSHLMLFPLTELICYISQFFRLQKGDLVFTGTPAGVGPIQRGDELVGFLQTKLGEQEMFRTRVR